MNWGTTMPFPEKFLHNKRDTMAMGNKALFIIKIKSRNKQFLTYHKSQGQTVFTLFFYFLQESSRSPGHIFLVLLTCLVEPITQSPIRSLKK